MTRGFKIDLQLRAPLRQGLLLNLVLLCLVLGTALLLVRWQYSSRSLHAALEKSEGQAKQLASENASRQAQKRQLIAPAQVERLAVQQLGMQTSDPSTTVYLSKAAP